MASRGQDLIQGMRQSCLRKGCGGVKLLSVIFRHMDKDYSKRLTRKEFKQGVVAFGMTELSENDLELLFQCFDKDANDTIDFDEFFRRLRPPLKKSREAIVNEAFDVIDVNNDGVIKMDDLKVFYSDNAKNHPKYLSREWTLEETLRSFLDSIDSPDDPDGIVTRDEFLDYYAGNWKVEISERAKVLFALMREQCLQRGHGGIKELAVIFRKMDQDFSKRICYEELRLGLELYEMDISESDLKLLFLSFDADENLQIDFAEFLHRLRPPLSPSRIKIINEVFENLDVNGDGAIKTDDLKVLFSSNSKSRSTEWTPEDEERLASFISNYDTPDNEDGKITREEFLNYYAGVSAKIPDDGFFVMTMKKCFGLPQ